LILCRHTLGLQLLCTLHAVKGANILAYSVFEDLNFILTQVGDCVLMLVAHHHIKENFP
jgi:hypothetical protein